MKRIVTALVLAPLAVALILRADFRILQIAVSGFALVCAWEFRNLIGHFQFRKPGFAALGIGLCLLLLPLPYSFPVVLVGTLLLLSLMLGADDMRLTLPSAGAGLLGVLYIFGSWKTALLLVRFDPHWLLLALAINWVGDTAAFAVGRLIGRHKMAPVISPAKSWEGAVGSLTISVVAATFYIRWFSPETPLPFAIVLAALANVAGQVGDLAESALKRGAGVKDSGAMLPGHGGWLDRLDSSLFSMPVVYTLLLTAQLLAKGF
ncbi:MAG: phosphatidate cytidylyltransferase [Bryobacterales bacterium]|nr:phosphatidate cytidylyltransferase [Bryobacterales bacterium]